MATLLSSGIEIAQIWLNLLSVAPKLPALKNHKTMILLHKRCEFTHHPTHKL